MLSRFILALFRLVLLLLLRSFLLLQSLLLNDLSSISHLLSRSRFLAVLLTPRMIILTILNLLFQLTHHFFLLDPIHSGFLLHQPLFPSCGVTCHCYLNTTTQCILGKYVDSLMVLETHLTWLLQQHLRILQQDTISQICTS